MLLQHFLSSKPTVPTREGKAGLAQVQVDPLQIERLIERHGHVLSLLKPPILSSQNNTLGFGAAASEVVGG